MLVTLSCVSGGGEFQSVLRSDGLNNFSLLACQFIIPIPSYQAPELLQN